MKQLVVISGKGGTGKTTVSAALADIASGATELMLADCDVDASNLPVLLKPEVEKSRDCVATAKAVKTTSCGHCGRCAEVCRFDAVDSRGTVNPIKCEGCGSCVYACPEAALELERRKTGTIFSSQTRFGPLLHADLKRGEEASGRLVLKIKKLLNDYADDFDLALVDGPPGTGCPVIASLRDASMALVVTEPTNSGFHDLRRVLDVVGEQNVRPYVCVNRADINQQVSDKIEDYCFNHSYDFVGRLPYDERVLAALKNRRTFVEAGNEELTEKLEAIWSELREDLIKNND